MTRALSPTRRPTWWPDVRAALPGWITERILVLGAVGLVRYLVDELHPARHTGRASLFAWDAAFYRDIVHQGYDLAGGSLRFFPLVPLLSRVLSPFGLGAGGGLLLVANVSALVGAALLFRLAMRETGDEGLAQRAAWLVALAPPAFVFTMGYADATGFALAVGAFLALRTRRWGWAAGAALLAGFGRPSAFLLVVPAAIEAGHGLAAAGARERLARLGAVVAAPAGTALYLAWVGRRFGDAFLPYRIQQQRNLHGEFTNPVTTVGHAIRGLLHGDAIGTGLHVPWLILVVVLVVITFRRWPVSYGAFAAVSVASAITSENLDSFERYALGAFPLVLTVAALTESPRVERIVLVVSGAAMVGYATLAFLGLSVP